MAFSEPSSYVPVNLPVSKEVKCFIDFSLTKTDGLIIPDKTTSVGREILRVFRQKRKSVCSYRMNTDYEDEVTIGVRHEQLLKMGVLITDVSIREMNLQLTSILKETLYRYLQLNLMANADYNILMGIQHWMEVVGITDDVRTVGAYERSFRNWRARNCPELMKAKGRPRAARQNVA
jgi:hypothetical protein